MALRFTKMHGLGNDFVVFDAINQSVELTAEQLQHIADRHFGIGCDQILLVESSSTAGVDFNYRIFNADGGEVDQCGNGARCFAQFVRQKGLSDKTEILVQTRAGRLTLRAQEGGHVSVDMGVPVFEPAAIPFDAPQEALEYALALPSQNVVLSTVGLGNPHAVLQVPDIEQAPITTLGPEIESHPRFPQRVNVGFLQVLDRSHARLRVYERGVGETLACGSGACAAMVAGRRLNLFDTGVHIELPGGTLLIEWHGEGEPVVMTGPATTVFEGEIDL